MMDYQKYLDYHIYNFENEFLTLRKNMHDESILPIVKKMEANVLESFEYYKDLFKKRMDHLNSRIKDENVLIEILNEAREKKIAEFYKNIFEKCIYLPLKGLRSFIEKCNTSNGIPGN